MTTNELHRDRTMVYNCRYPVVFRPKYRRKVLVSPIDGRIKAQIIEKQDKYGDAIIEMEVMPDHAHLLLDVDPRIGGVDPRIGIDEVVPKITTSTARNIPGRNPVYRGSHGK